MTSNISNRVRFGPYEVDLHTHELWKFGTRMKLVGQPFEILAVLLSRAGELVTRDELRGRLWPSDTFIDFNHGLNAAVNKLREALSDSAESPRYVETLPRRGYRFIARVEWVETGTAAPPEQGTLPASPIEPQRWPEVTSRREAAILPTSTHNTWSGYFMGAGLLFTLLIFAALAIRTVSTLGDASAARPVVEHTRPLTPISDSSTPAFSPDANSVAFYRDGPDANHSGIYVAAVGSDRVNQLTGGGDDCCPVWSPDGRWIAFSRVYNREYSIHIVPADGDGETRAEANNILAAQTAVPAIEKVAIEAAQRAHAIARALNTGGIVPRRGEIDWSPDGKNIAFAGPDGIYLLEIDASKARRITEAPPLTQDWGPCFSPDGSTLLFVRDQETDLSNEILSVSANGGKWSHILSERGRIGSSPQWSFDGRAIIFSSNRTGHPELWRASLNDPSSVVQMSEAGSSAWDPAVSRRGYRLAFERIMRTLSIWQMNLAAPNKHTALLVSSTSDTDQGPGPQFSPDGTKLAYMSDRSGTMEIWISNRDGSNPYQLSAVGGAGTPRWSPDSQSVVFDTITKDHGTIISMNVHGGAPQMLTPDPYSNVCPSWSRDGRWVYFASYRPHTFQVWKVPAGGGTPIQVTRHGGHAALESLDGKFLYYAKNQFAEPGIWRVPVGGGEEKPVPLVRPGTWASWQVVKGGIVFVGPSLGHQAVVSYYDFARDRTTSLTVLNRTPFWLGASLDGKTIAFDQPGQEHAQAMLVENFR